MQWLRSAQMIAICAGRAGLAAGASKELAEFGEGVEFEQMLGRGRGIEIGMFEDPGVFVKKKYGMEAGGQRGVDVAFGTVADHPTAVRREFMPRHHLSIGGRVFFRHDFDCGKVS